MFTSANPLYMGILTHRSRKMAEMRRPMDFWKGMVLSSNFTCLDGDLRIMIGPCTTSDLCCLSPLWSIRLRKS